MEIAEARPGREEVLALYDSVGWAVYTREPATLLRGLAGSHVVLTARDEAGTLVGLARTISDDATVCYLQDLLVAPAAQRTGVGSALLAALLSRYAHCRFFLLSTDRADAAEAAVSHPFYRRMGLVPHEEQEMAAFVRPLG